MPPIEELLQANTAALTENTAALKAVESALAASNAGREAAVEKIAEAAGAASGAGRPAGSRNKAAKDKTPATTTEPPVAKTAADILTAGSAFLNTDDAPLKAKRREFVKTMLAHFKVEKISLLPAEHADQIVEWLAAKTADIDAEIDFGGDDASADEEEDDLMS